MKNEKKFDVEIYINQSSGITLVALVITIIILLILTGVSLNLISGSSGILGKTQKASEITQLAAIKEQMQLDLSTAQMDAFINGESEISDKNLKEIVSKYGELQKDGDTIITENGNISLKEIYQKSSNGGESSSDINGSETVDNTQFALLTQKIQNLETEITTLKTNVNTLNTADNTMQNSINSLKNVLSPTGYIKPSTTTGVTIKNGGYYKLGNIVFVNIGLKVDSSILELSNDSAIPSTRTLILDNFPLPDETTSLAANYTTVSDGLPCAISACCVLENTGKITMSIESSRPYLDNAGINIIGTYLAKE